NHQGVIAVLSPIEYVDIMEIYDQLIEDGKVPLIVVLDSITDVRNFGGIARSAECAGAHALVVSLKNSAPVNADAIKTSAGALTVIPVCRVGSIRNCLKFLQSKEVQLVAATEKADKRIYDADFTKPTAIIMGSEDKGISQEILKMCDERLSIPLKGDIESLNVSAAAAVMLFEAVRQRG
ncbi:MAG: 23S rRNA (guanosine(2251)-2'-O)-methyltransferase RlmB, partial [Rikenellaceae bacterium]